MFFIGSSFILVECFSQDIKRNLNIGLLGSNNNTWGPPLQNNNNIFIKHSSNIQPNNITFIDNTTIQFDSNIPYEST